MKIPPLKKIPLLPPLKRGEGGIYDKLPRFCCRPFFGPGLTAAMVRKNYGGLVGIGWSSFIKKMS